MNLKKQAKQLEYFLEKEIPQTALLTELSDGSLAYLDFVITKNKNGNWGLRRASGVDQLDSFKLKSSAVIAASFYSRNKFKNYNELKLLDDSFSNHFADATRYKALYKKATDHERRDIFVARFVESSQKAEYAKKQLVSHYLKLPQEPKNPNR